jgi:hypothetical protein
MPDHSRREAIRTVIGAALASASSVSLIGAAFAKGHDEILVTTNNGIDIKISDLSRGSIMSEGLVVNARPSGRYFLPNGQSVVFEDGLLVDGTAVSRQYAWMAFALKSQRGQKYSNPAVRQTSKSLQQTRIKQRQKSTIR